MSTILQDVPEVQAAYDEYKRFAADPVMRERIKSRERYWTDRHLDRAEAREEGEVKGKIDVARNLKDMGLSPSDIAKATGLPLSEIERLG